MSGDEDAEDVDVDDEDDTDNIAVLLVLARHILTKNHADSASGVIQRMISRSVERNLYRLGRWDDSMVERTGREEGRNEKERYSGDFLRDT